jgi:hypothetical protein
MRARAVAMAITMGLFGVSPQVRAQDECRDQATEAWRLSEAGQLDLAVQKYEAAAEGCYSPVIVLFWAKTEVRRGRLLRAIELLDRIAATPLPLDAKESWRSAADESGVLRGELDAKIPEVEIAVLGETSAATKVTIDGQDIRGSKPLRLDPGRHRFEARDGPREVARTADVAPGARITVELPLPPPTSGESTPDGVDWERLTPPLVAYGIGAAALVVGTVAGAVYLGKVSDVSDTCPNDECPESARDLVDETSTLGTVTTIAFAVTLVGAAVGTALLLFPLGDDVEVTVSPTLGPTVAGGTLRLSL